MSIACHRTMQLCAAYASLHRGLCSSALLSKNEENISKKTWVTPQMEQKKLSWNVTEEPTDVRHQVPPGEWRGVLHHFVPRKGVSIDVLHYLQKSIDIRPSALQKWWSSLQTEAATKDQMYKSERVAALGFDLSAAHFVVHRGGKVRFKNAQGWIQQDEDGEYDLVRHYQPGVFVEELDASGINLVYEGLESMKNLKHLKSLSVADCPHINDWCIDRICAEFSDTLQHLDISGCRKVTHFGVAALARLRHLRTLNLHGLENIKDIKLLCLLLQDHLPELKISGIDYLSTKAS